MKLRRIPPDIPRRPASVYAQEWVSYPHWFGKNLRKGQRREWLAFEKARSWARASGAKTDRDWRELVRQKKLPPSIPSNPQRVYSDEWGGLGDWLGTDTVAPQLRKYRSFKDARTFARRLQLKSEKDWKAYCLGGSKPVDIPASPMRVYAASGWAGMGDWLGTGIIATTRRKYLPFPQAQAFAQQLGFKGQADWKRFAQSGKKRPDIPTNPDQHYRGKGWTTWDDWLGTGAVAPYLRKYLPFEAARAYVRLLGLRSYKEWRAFAKSGSKPDKIPMSADSVYRNSGWVGWSDWLRATSVTPRGKVA